jgi:hypothetical protein
MAKKMKCPECKEECQFGRFTKNGWELVSIKEKNGYVIFGSHFNHIEIGGHCHIHKISKKKLIAILKTSVSKKPTLDKSKGT